MNPGHRGSGLGPGPSSACKPLHRIGQESGASLGHLVYWKSWARGCVPPSGQWLPLDPSRAHSRLDLHARFTLIMMFTHCLHSLLFRGAARHLHSSQMHFSAPPGEWPEVTSPWKQLLIPRLLSDVLWSDVSLALVSWGVWHPSLCLYCWAGMSRRFLHLLPPFLCESKEQKELEIPLIWKDCYHKGSKALAVRGQIRGETTKVTCPFGGLQAGGALETLQKGQPRAKGEHSVLHTANSHCSTFHQGSPNRCRARGYSTDRGQTPSLKTYL